MILTNLKFWRDYIHFLQQLASHLFNHINLFFRFNIKNEKRFLAPTHRWCNKKCWLLYICGYSSVETHQWMQTPNTNWLFFCHKHSVNTLNTLYRSCVPKKKTKGVKKILQHLQFILTTTVPPLPKRIHIQITAVLINRSFSTEYFRTGVVLATYSNVLFIVASCTEGIPMDSFFVLCLHHNLKKIMWIYVIF